MLFGHAGRSADEEFLTSHRSDLCVPLTDR
jgi:hypothetical protein